MSTICDSPNPVRDFDRLLGCLDQAGPRAVGRHAGFTLASHFQPIFSLSHGRVVGHESLLRATDASGAGVPPPRFFDVADADELRWRDRLARTVHVANYTRSLPTAQWLFQNVHPQVFRRSPQMNRDSFQQDLLRHFALRGEQVVIEVLEAAVQDDSDLQAAVELVRSRGCLIALDDFGAGHSNFDRVWRLRPEIVKLDRSLVARAALDLRARRIVVQMASLLHECGALVLMEGVETEAEAFVALEADADLVQGYFFARPQPALVEAQHASTQVDALWDDFSARWRDEQSSYRERIAPYQNAIGYASALLAGGRSFGEASQGFLALPGAEVCYLLGAEGEQIGVNAWGAAASPAAQHAFSPFNDTRGARWARRPYFRRAIGAVGKPQVTRPYRTLHGAHLCVTVSIAYRAPAHQGGGLRVVCGDVTWD